MKDYMIVTDSTCDLPLNLIEELGVKVIPMEFSIGEKSYEYSPYSEDLSMKDFYDHLRNGGVSSTSQINIVHYCEVFEEILKKDLDILYIAFSSALSGTYNTSLIAKDMVLEDYPDSNIVCVDSRAASLGEGLLVYLASKEKESGLDIFELENWILENRDNLCHWFTVDDLEHLYRGGRVSKISAAVGSTLKVKPVLHVNQDGELIPKKKVCGRKKSLKELIKKMEEFGDDIDSQHIFIGHGDCLEDARYLEKLIKEQFSPKDILIGNIGPIIGTHSGPGTIALFFYGNEF